MKKNIDVLIYKDRDGISIGIKSLYDVEVTPVTPFTLKELTASSFASVITSEICKMFKLDDIDDEIYDNIYDYGCHILAMPDKLRSMITISLQVNVADPAKDFGNKIKIRREYLGIKREYVASKMNVSTSTITKWESGERNVPMNRLVELCNILEVSPNELLGWEE
jgi:DNA-binding helix-turn-helix protein